MAVAAAETMNHYRQRRWAMPEAGGILLGRLIVHAPRVVVDAVTVPSRWDRWARFSFVRAKGPAQHAINRAWDTYDHARNYLGEWHTHPEDDPTPSALDVEQWCMLARTATFEQDVLYFLIVGRVQVRAWEVGRAADLVTPLETI
ncbi:MAG: Mov34/MPN/PAD-1 family protein [Mycolicibacterium frederiksbergense]|nr:Mov34/MPN/PAD-1 family protein [Mycolicibacterium frederiksbergense]